MADEQRIQQLIEELMESRHTPEEACAEDPELLPIVRERWQRICEIESHLESFFPTPHHGGPRRNDQRRTPLSFADLASDAHGKIQGALPQLPGYRIEAVLGRGGMGVVYRATHLKLKRPVAIKMLLAGDYASAQELACLLREAQAVARLHHEHIVQVYDVAELDGLPYFTMELIEGGTLAQKLAGTPQPAKEAAALAVTLAGAVESAHRGGIVHRDLKPSNILLTAAGVPKIADFSLARNMEGDSALTLSTARIGTPSYMAPEQVTGKTGAFCPSVDIYALGAILYEALTGRPPFRAETPAETQRQVITQDPAPPSRLNARVPRDLETICLKALQKDPRRRYTTAAALADDLHRYLSGEPVTARPTGRAERAVKWLRRRPAHATAVAAVAFVALTLAAVGAGVAIRRQRTVRLVTDDLRESERSQASMDWPGARAAITRAKARLDESDGAGWLGGGASLHKRLAQSERDLELVARLDAVRLDRSQVVIRWNDSQKRRAAADLAYEAAFNEAGLANPGDAAPVVALRIENSSVRPALLAAIDDWAGCNAGIPSAPRLEWLLEIARAVDPDPSGWRDSVRDPRVWKRGGKNADGKSLADLAAAMPEQERSLSLLTAIGERLAAQDQKAVAIPFLTRAQRLHPSDFWVNSTLGVEHGEENPAASSRYLQAAVSLRPSEPVTRANLGISLALSGNVDEAINQLREAIKLDPGTSFMHDALGNALVLAGRYGEAVEEYGRALAIDPRSRSARNNFGKALAELATDDAGIDRAIEQFKLAVEIDPNYPEAHSNIGLMLRKQGRFEGALEYAQKAVDLNPAIASCQLNLGLVLKDVLRYGQAVEHLDRAVELDPRDAAAHYTLGHVLSGLADEPGVDPALAKRAAEAEACYREALRCNPRYAPALHGLGVLAGESRDFDQASHYFRKALEADPKYLVARGALGRALMLQGRYAEARDAMQQFLDSLPPADPRAPGVASLIKQCEMKIAEEVSGAAK